MNLPKPVDHQRQTIESRQNPLKQSNMKGVLSIKSVEQRDNANQHASQKQSPVGLTATTTGDDGNKAVDPEQVARQELRVIRCPSFHA